jgi:hypothetical protein
VGVKIPAEIPSRTSRFIKTFGVSCRLVQKQIFLVFMSAVIFAPRSGKLTAMAAELAPQFTWPASTPWKA